MTVQAESPFTASSVLAEAGVEEDHAFYGPFTGEAEKAVLTVPQMIKAAWQANDARAFAGVFTDNGSLLMKDDQLISRDEIHTYMAEAFRGAYKGARVTGRPLMVKFFDSTTAMVVTQGGIIFPGETDVPADREIRAMWIMVMRDGRWKLLSHQSSPIAG